MVNSKDELQSSHLLLVRCLATPSLSTAQNTTLSPAKRHQ